MTRAKICGLTRQEDLDAVVAAGADAVGLIAGVTVETPREISLNRATTLAETIPPFVTSVLVTMPDSPAQANERIERVQPDAIQVHGASIEMLDVLADAPTKVIVAVDADDDLTRYADSADALLVDSLDADGGGGTGETHDWKRTRETIQSLSVPIVLAGGLTPDNVAEAVRTVEPYAVDTASGVEREGGIKNHDAVEQFIDRARRARVTA